VDEYELAATVDSEDEEAWAAALAEARRSAEVVETEVWEIGRFPQSGQLAVGDASGGARMMYVCALGLVFGIITYSQLNRMPVHTAMRDVSELIYTTCKTYLKQQGRFLLLLWAFIAAIIV